MDLARLLNLCFCGAQGRALWCSWSKQLFGDVPWFTAQLVANLFEFLVLLPFAVGSRQYYDIFSVVAWFTLAMRVAAGCECWTLSMQQYPSVGRSASALAWIAAGIGILGAVIVGLPGFNILSLEHKAALQVWHILAVRYSSAAIFCVCALAWILNCYFENGVSPNAARHAAIMTGYHGSLAVGYLVISNFPKHSQIAGMLSAASASGFYVLWGSVMTTTGRTRARKLILEADGIADQLPLFVKKIYKASA